MCDLCWNADLDHTWLDDHKKCNEKGTILTFAQLKKLITQRWIDTDQTHYRVIKKAIYNPPTRKLCMGRILCTRGKWID